MKSNFTRFNSAWPWRRFAVTSASLCFGFAAASLQARPVPQNLAGGLGALVESNLTLQSQTDTNGAQNALFNGYATQQAAYYASVAIQDPGTGRFLVDIHPRNSSVTAEKLVPILQKNFPSFTLTALDTKYHGVGVVEGFISLDEVPALGNMREVRSVTLGLKPELNRPVNPGGGIQPGTALRLLGTTTDQGVYQHRVDQINKFYNPSAKSDFEGSGTSIGFISDSIGRITRDVRNFDLPGAGNNPVNTQPVVILQDLPGTDEGRGMGQIVYKMAPKARIAFATADGGEVNFANNIRALAALPGFEYPPAVQKGFKADTICDDVGYSDEPFFEDGLIGNAVDEVFAAGVSYFSSAGNDIGTYDYDSDYRNVPNGPNALDGTNIKLAGVPTDLYQGGFHNFNPNPGQQDVAQTVNVLPPSAGEPATNFQWDDPYNQVLNFDPNPIYTAHGDYTNMDLTFTTPTLTAGQNYVITVTADEGSSFDAIVTIKDPNGNVVVDAQDTGTDETINFYPPVTGQYTIIVMSFGGTTGAFTVNIYNGLNPQLTTDFNLLVFDLGGHYLPSSSLTTNNYATNIPFEYGVTLPKKRETQVQYVIARSSVPTAPQPATHIRWIIRGNGLSGIGPAEYFTVNTPNIHGHAMANGCNGTAAYSVFRPSIPEYFTSPGPATVYFDTMGNRLPIPEVRLQPGVAAADGANTSFFGGDDVGDLDLDPNFYGTSAAAPHAAAIAALVLEAHGGPGTVTPSQMMDILHSTSFQHDLDPNYASGNATTSEGGSVRFTANTDLGLNPSSGINNVNHLTITYQGPGSITSLVFNPEGTADTAGNTTGGNNGLDLTNTYFSNVYPGIVFEPLTKAFTVGDSDVSASDISASFSNQAPLPSIAGQWWTMSLAFANDSFTNGKVVKFTVGHGPQHNRVVTNGLGQDGGATSTSFVMADLFGGELLLPDGAVTKRGMTFSGTTSHGGTFSGTINNKIGDGWSKTDGFGFINAEAAVRAPLN
ncbi:MAG: S8 family serine peptidase [Chthoniobacterales bacterium]